MRKLCEYDIQIFNLFCIERNYLAMVITEFPGVQYYSIEEL